MKKMMCALVLATVLAVSGAATALPKVVLDPSCSFQTAIDSQAGSLLSTLSMFIQDLPEYTSVDLEQAMHGDGIPDSWQLALLAQALCTGDSALNAQLNTNKAAYTQLLTDLTSAVNIILGSPVTAANRLDARMLAVATILNNHSSLTGATELAEDLTTLAGKIGTALDKANKTFNLAGVPNLLNSFNNFSSFVGALLGLSTEMQDTITVPLAEYLADVQDGIAQVNAAIQVAQAIAASNELTADEKAKVNALITDAGNVITIVNSIVALPEHLTVYGTSKGATEPFSAAGDYDGDGQSNLTVYQSVASSGGNKAQFVATASGASPFWPDNPVLPAVGVVGLALLSGLVSLGGALKLRRK